MLSRKGSSAGTVDRGRVRERLQAALAGLQELRLLRDRHGDMVSWALQLDREEPVSALCADPVEAEEQRLEATLTALKQQLSRLRKQDVGLKTHLQQLDQQISELKLDVSKASTDQLESDSRPSSGFYELSDGGSCSRSNSCTSVYSECLSSSQTSLIPLSPTGCHVSPPPQVDVFHRRSVDESPGQPNPPRTTGLHLGSSRIRASAIGTDYQTRPRPVSTGDLERIMAQGLGCFRSADAKKLPVCPKQKISPVDPKFQRNLESCGGTEVYPYPSPLHAVALQSPIFFQGGEDRKLVLREGQGASSNGYDSLQMGYKNKTLGYIDKLLQRTWSKSQINAETVEIQDSNQTKPAENINVSFEVSQTHESSLIPPQAKNQNLPVNGEPIRNRTVHSNQQLNDRKSHESLRGPDIQCKYSYRAVMKEYSSDEVSHSTLKKNDKPKTENSGLPRNHSDKNCGESLETEMRKSHWQRPFVAQTSSPSFEVQSGNASSPEFVHAKFVPASSQRVKVRQADRKTKAVKLKRKSSDKPRALRQQHSFSSGERTKEVGFGARGEQRRSGKGKVSEKGSAWQTHEHRQRSSSESSLYGPGVRITQKGHPKPHPVPASKLSKNRRPQSMEYEHPVEQRRRRQATPKWQSDVDIYQAPFLQHQRSKESMQMVRSLKPGQWIGPSHPFHFSMSSNSFLQSLNARYPPAPFNMTSLYPPRCESEYSAECASLFHSTIAESSEGEMSDNTTNRFGDSESSQSSQSFSDSDSSLSLDEEEEVEINEAAEGGMVWAEAALGPTAAGQPLRQLPSRPEPAACRIKASRALKKKIRRFQPASLKVMTLV